MNSIRTENIFIKKIKDLFLSDDYKNINVNKLCKSLKLKRQTFYYHYNDLSDLIFSMLLAEDIGDFGQITDIKNIGYNLIEYFENNKKLINRLFELNGDSSIECFIYEVFYSKASKILTVKYKNELNIKQINLLNYLLSSYISKAIVYYLSINQNFENKKFINFYDSIILGIEKKFFENVINS